MKKIVAILKRIKFLLTNYKSIKYGLRFIRSEISNHPLTRLADKYGSDKGFRSHLYTRIYSELFRQQNSNVESLLEIGLLLHEDQRELGGKSFSKVPSLDMWVDYFPHARIFGFDIQDFSKASGKWERIFQGDQSNRDHLSQLKTIGISFDIIIDDALHASYHQQTSLSYLFELVSPGGLYIIEDLNFQPKDVEKQYKIEKTLFYLRQLKDNGKWNSPVATQEEKTFLEKNIIGVEFYNSLHAGIKNKDSLAVITKKL